MKATLERTFQKARKQLIGLETDAVSPDGSFRIVSKIVDVHGPKAPRMEIHDSVEWTVGEKLHEVHRRRFVRTVELYVDSFEINFVASRDKFEREFLESEAYFEKIADKAIREHKQRQDQADRIEIPYQDNRDDCGDEPCLICGRELENPEYFVEVVDGGSHAAAVGSSPDQSDGGYMAFHPIGPECRRKLPARFIHKSAEQVEGGVQ